jgi:membrane fusion protein, copper/silver efflux system
MKRLVTIVLVLFAAAGLTIAAGALSGCAKGGSEGVQYHCPMDPEVTSDQPGTCPKCGMSLESIRAKREAPAAAERKILFYRSPMDPTVTSPVPAKDQMGMDYVPVYAEAPTPTPEGLAGLAPVSTDERGILLAGIQTSVATRDRLRTDIRAYGVVTVDETRVTHVHTKIAGTVEKLFVNFTGQTVRAGQPILTLYSPELLASQEELLRALENSRRFSGTSPEMRTSGEELVTAARSRLRLFDVPDDFIAEIEKTGAARREVTLKAPASGFVMAKQIVQGQQVEPAMELFTVVDLSRVWIEAEFYEYEAREVRVGQAATFTLAYQPGVQLAGKVAYVSPFLNPASRTLKVRFEFGNGDLSLKPGMYVNVTLERQAVETVLIPDSAVLDSGLRQVVFVEAGPGRFVPREVRLGARGEGRVQVLAGIEVGERVVVKGAFLIDSESRMRSAIGGATAAPPPKDGGDGGPP